MRAPQSSRMIGIHIFLPLHTWLTTRDYTVFRDLSLWKPFPGGHLLSSSHCPSVAWHSVLICLFFVRSEGRKPITMLLASYLQKLEAVARLPVSSTHWGKSIHCLLPPSPFDLRSFQTQESRKNNTVIKQRPIPCTQIHLWWHFAPFAISLFVHTHTSFLMKPLKTSCTQ